MKPYIRNLLDFAEEAGVKVHKVSHKQFNENQNIQHAPFASHIGIIWNTKELFYVSDAQWPAMVHELGHLIATKDFPVHGKCNEFDFFGWEIALVREIGAPIDAWLKDNEEYGVEGSQTIKDLSVLQFHKVCVERLERALELGILNEACYPLAVR